MLDSDLAIEPNDDEILKIFFDDSFVPQPFVDILLSNAADKDLNQVQSISSSLLGRLDYYTRHLTKELESTIRKLENLSDTLPGTWELGVTDDITNAEYTPNAMRNLGGSSKLEYYLDTLGGAVRALENDVTRIDIKIDQLNLKDDIDSSPIEKLKKLKKIKERLLKVSQNFNTLKIILEISSGDRSKIITDKKLHLNLSDFKISLKTLEETISQNLNNPAKDEESLETNKELLKKIELFAGLKPLFKGLDRFYPLYSEFTDNIEEAYRLYMGPKSIEDEMKL